MFGVENSEMGRKNDNDMNVSDGKFPYLVFNYLFIYAYSFI